jgi:hypothetical protein
VAELNFSRVKPKGGLSHDCCLSEQCRVYCCYYTDLDDPVHHDDKLLPDEPAVVVRQGAVRLSVVEGKHPTPLSPPEPLVALLVIQSPQTASPETNICHQTIHQIK